MKGKQKSVTIFAKFPCVNIVTILRAQIYSLEKLGKLCSQGVLTNRDKFELINNYCFSISNTEKLEITISPVNKY